MKKVEYLYMSLKTSAIGKQIFPPSIRFIKNQQTPSNSLWTEIKKHWKKIAISIALVAILILFSQSLVRNDPISIVSKHDLTIYSPNSFRSRWDQCPLPELHLSLHSQRAHSQKNSLNSAIIETSSFLDVLSCVENQGRVVLLTDIDNTVLRSTNQSGSVSDLEFLVSSLVENGLSLEKAIQIHNAIWPTYQESICVEPVEKEIPSIIRKLQKKDGVTVLALTSRLLSTQNITERQLRDIGIKFFNISIHSPLYKNGILYSRDFQKKSDVLKGVLKELSPKKIVYVDDKKKHVLDIEKCAKEFGISFVGIRYSGADDQVEKFNKTIAKIQWNRFSRKVADQEVREAIESAMV